MRVSQTREAKTTKIFTNLAYNDRLIKKQSKGFFLLLPQKQNWLRLLPQGFPLPLRSIIEKYSTRLVEPPVTSRYKPLVHKVMAYGGTPSYTDDGSSQSVMLEYSYGNNLQGFANKKINRHVNKEQKV